MGYELARCIMKVGDVETSREHICAALLLYLRGLDILEMIIKDVQRWIELYTASQKYLKRNQEAQNKHSNDTKELSSLSTKFKQLLLDGIQCYDDHWKRGEAIQTLCATQCLEFEVASGNVDGVLFRFAID